MNEDRHAGNWGEKENKIAPLFDHNLSFGGEIIIRDLPTLMKSVTSPFNVEGQYEQRHDDILKYLVNSHLEAVIFFTQKIKKLKPVQHELWQKYFPKDCERLNKILFERIEYMAQKVREYSAK